MHCSKSAFEYLLLSHYLYNLLGVQVQFLGIENHCGAKKVITIKLTSYTTHTRHDTTDTLTVSFLGQILMLIDKNHNWLFARTLNPEKEKTKRLTDDMDP